jgi:hypothetical protein
MRRAKRARSARWNARWSVPLVAVCIAVASALPWASAGCPDYEPLHQKASAIASITTDAGVAIEGSTEARQACRDCFLSHCKDACDDDQICKDSMNCALEEDCAFGRTQVATLECARPCMVDAGWVTGLDNPTTSRLVGASQCGLDNCASICNVQQ